MSALTSEARKNAPSDRPNNDSVNFDGFIFEQPRERQESRMGVGAEGSWMSLP